MAKIDDVQRSIDGLGEVVNNLQKQFQDFREFLVKYLAENMATKHDLERFAAKEELRNYAAMVEKAVVKSIRAEEEDLAHRQEHEDLRKRVESIESVPAITHSLHKN